MVLYKLCLLWVCRILYALTVPWSCQTFGRTYPYLGRNPAYMAGYVGTPCRSGGFPAWFSGLLFSAFSVRDIRSNSLRSTESFLQQQLEAWCVYLWSWEVFFRDDTVKLPCWNFQFEHSEVPFCPSQIWLFWCLYYFNHNWNSLLVIGTNRHPIAISLEFPTCSFVRFACVRTKKLDPCICYVPG